MTDDYKALESQIREIYGRVVYSHKTHEKCSDILKSRSNKLKVLEIVLSALTTTSILSVLLGSGRYFEVASAVFATLSLFLTLYAKDFDFLALAEKHKQSALVILDLREKFLSLIVDIHIGNKTMHDLQIVRDELNVALVNAYIGAPKTFNAAYSKAVDALKNNEEFTFTDVEINCFLPEYLRKI